MLGALVVPTQEAFDELKFVKDAFRLSGTHLCIIYCTSRLLVLLSISPKP